MNIFFISNGLSNIIYHKDNLIQHNIHMIDIEINNSAVIWLTYSFNIAKVSFKYII
ncbi:hypothetical protein EST35_0040 [Pseudomonas phage vB_PaeM_PA5oct]|uniref:Uncharacterized protein n=1 Tax=Pseudomonas phage vB_PaeM_PA5oct TaxID=2163605 RepID=A0A4Y5JWV8_9CAUD|nr:hypothetical protein PQE65_gp442 [Pseudomonas phage vB_PaeM_PA5oct]QCG75923.1 hypothetical protein EST35_0040 [Pseudomonas phage vB_PaeM_PA5oct]